MAQKKRAIRSKKSKVPAYVVFAAGVIIYVVSNWPNGDDD